MNIFEALEAGNGRATLPGVCDRRYATNKLKWHGEVIYLGCSIGNREDDINKEDLKSNDWEPYVPRETKIKHKEVFENVKWYTDYIVKSLVNEIPQIIVHPGFNLNEKYEILLNKPGMRMTLEWEK